MDYPTIADAIGLIALNAAIFACAVIYVVHANLSH